MGAAADVGAVHDRPAGWDVENTIHLGMEYAALLVDDGYRPANTRDALPPIGTAWWRSPPSTARENFQARASKVLTFSGYEWDVRSIPSDRGGPNDYDPDNAWTDAEGLLHLKLAKRDGRWTSAGSDPQTRGSATAPTASPSAMSRVSIRRRRSAC